MKENHIEKLGVSIPNALIIMDLVSKFRKSDQYPLTKIPSQKKEENGDTIETLESLTNFGIIDEVSNSKLMNLEDATKSLKSLIPKIEKIFFC